MADMDIERCVRCGHAAPSVEADDYTLWEASTEGELICPGCVTGTEETAMAEDMMQLSDTTPLDDPADPRGDPL